MDKILCKLTAEDAKKLRDSIVETEMSGKVYADLAKDPETTPFALETAIQFYIASVKAHKTLWLEILNKYVGEEETGKKYPILRYDIAKNVIFLKEIEGCPLCK